MNVGGEMHCRGVYHLSGGISLSAPAIHTGAPSATIAKNATMHKNNIFVGCMRD